MAGIAAVVVCSLMAHAARADERQFLVILATSPKQFDGQTGNLVNPELINRQYFDNDPNNDPTSFLEYWQEISYGDVTIAPSPNRDKVTDWISLPWRITQADGTGGYTNLNGSDDYEYGASEFFLVDRAMVTVDIDGDPNGLDNGPASPIFNPAYAIGGGDSTPGVGSPVWMPGERFADVDGDGRWDGLDEAANSMDWDNDGRPDNLGPWIDLNQDNVPDHPGGCLYLRDSDNDGNPDCCPDGPGTAGCEPLPATNACSPTNWDGPQGQINDCNGNLIPDACDVSCVSQACLASGWRGDLCGESEDKLPLNSRGDTCDAQTVDGIPDECQFLIAGVACVTTPPEDDVDDPCLGVPACVPMFPPIRTVPRCEFHDVSGDGLLDVVEPFENFLRQLNGAKLSNSYIQNNYPGHPEKVIALRNVRTLRGKHYSDDNVPGGAICQCADGTPCDVDRTCVAGSHAEYNPPDFWADAGSTKASVGGASGSVDTGLITPKPTWYRQAWQDRYGTIPPPWTEEILVIEEVDLSQRRFFGADRGGVNADGTGLLGQQVADFLILPEEVRGVNQPLILFDGYVEHDDLASSKYHRTGDQRLGEVTSPFNSDIWGHDRGAHRPSVGGLNPDLEIPAAGPYATQIHANFGRDGGNVMQMELLTRRTDGQHLSFGTAWLGDAVFDAEDSTRSNPYAENFGFRDYNLDGVVDQGEVRSAGGENYVTEPDGTGNGTNSDYPWNRRRLLEDCIEILDDVIDFDDFVDTVTLDRVTCDGVSPGVTVPAALAGDASGPGIIRPKGLLSGIVLLPEGAYATGIFERAPGFYPIHNEDGLDDPQNVDVNLPPGSTGQINWNLFVHDLVIQMGSSPFQTPYSAHEYLHTWEKFPDLYDYDIFDAGAIENCPIGEWDIMANGGLVHPGPILKERRCSDWTEPVDLTTVLTPGVDAVLTLPPAELVRDESYYFIENENRLGERYYLWSAGLGFDEKLPGTGMLIQHTDVGSNPDAIPPQQRSCDRPTYSIVEADGNGDLCACTAGGNRGDAGDPWPGSTGATEFSFYTNPAATWYTQNSWSGINISDVEPDASGSVQLTINWVPTSIPSLRFVDPPGGQSVAGSFNVRFEVTDVYGGTTIRLYYMPDERTCSGSGASCADNTDCPADEQCRYDTRIGPGGATLIGSQDKETPGTKLLSEDWNISSIPDGRYVLFAKLNPGTGADGTEDKHTRPRAGRNNIGNGTLTIGSVGVDNDADDTDDTARLETWTVVCIDPNGQNWLVNSTLTQPALNEADPTQDPYPTARTGIQYTSTGSAVVFTINPGTVPYALGDTFSFTTTGITAVSQAVTMADGEISENPVARISASPLSGDPPLTVNFDGNRSFDPNDAPLEYLWDFGDESPLAAGDAPTHVYTQARTFTARLTVTNRALGLFGVALVDIVVVNNSPKAKILANPLSGPDGLEVAFDGSRSSDTETPGDELIYQWDFGDGGGANATGSKGILITTGHFYVVDQAFPCTRSTAIETFLKAELGATAFADALTRVSCYTATLTVTDQGEKTSADFEVIEVGNTLPVPGITPASARIPEGTSVTFNAMGSFEPDSADDLWVLWDWGDDSEDDGPYPVTGPPGVTDGSVIHEYKKTGERREYRPHAIVFDSKGGKTDWFGKVVVSDDAAGESTPKADFRLLTANQVDPDTRQLVVLVDVPVEVDASLSYDRPPGDPIAQYRWDWGDGSDEDIGRTATHTYTEVGDYEIKLTVFDGENPPNADDSVKFIRVQKDPSPLPGDNEPPSASFVADPSKGVVGEAVIFNAGSSSDPNGDVLSFEWSFGDRTSGVGSFVSHVYTEPGSYLVRLTVRDTHGATSVKTQRFEVTASVFNLAPQVFIGFIDEDRLRGPAPLILEFDGTNSYDPDGPDEELTFAWYVDNGIRGTERRLTLTFNEPGTYRVQLLVSDVYQAVGASEVLIVEVLEGLPPADIEPGRDVPGGGGGGAGGGSSSGQFCGLGMIMGLVGSLLGLFVMMAARRRRPDEWRMANSE